jgi:uncharacterized damage-inducible protein DinB
MLDQFCKYNNWANSLLFDTLIAHADVVPESCVLLFSHIVNAQSIWISRINATIPSVTVWQLHDLQTCGMLLEESVNSMLLMEVPRAADSPLIRYKTSTGAFYETSVADILLHMFNHGTYHRAQIAREMSAHQLAPVNTDYIQFVRV